MKYVVSSPKSENKNDPINPPTIPTSIFPMIPNPWPFLMRPAIQPAIPPNSNDSRNSIGFSLVCNPVFILHLVVNIVKKSKIKSKFVVYSKICYNNYVIKR